MHATVADFRFLKESVIPVQGVVCLPRLQDRCRVEGFKGREGHSVFSCLGAKMFASIFYKSLPGLYGYRLGHTSYYNSKSYFVYYLHARSWHYWRS